MHVTRHRSAVTTGLGQRLGERGLGCSILNLFSYMPPAPTPHTSGSGLVFQANAMSGTYNAPMKLEVHAVSRSIIGKKQGMMEGTTAK
jgi:hypothetical protein